MHLYGPLLPRVCSTLLSSLMTQFLADTVSPITSKNCDGHQWVRDFSGSCSPLT